VVFHTRRKKIYEKLVIQCDGSRCKTLKNEAEEEEEEEND
jgi:hypothetical protein